MSYDLHLLLPVPDEEPLATAHARLEMESEEINLGLPHPHKEARKTQLMRALRLETPTLQPFEFGYSEIAQMNGISEEEARIRYRHIELNGAEDGNGIQITLYDDGADVTIPYWHQPAAARVVFDEVWRYLRILQNVGGFFVYDPQLDRQLDVDTDLSSVVARYGGVVAKVPEIVKRAEEPPRPWWKRW